MLRGVSFLQTFLRTPKCPFTYAEVSPKPCQVGACGRRRLSGAESHRAGARLHCPALLAALVPTPSHRPGPASGASRSSWASQGWGWTGACVLGWGPAWHRFLASGPTAPSVSLPGTLVRDGVCLSVSTGLLLQPNFGVRKTEGSPVNQMCWGMSAPVLFKEAPKPWESEGVAHRLFQCPCVLPSRSQRGWEQRKTRQLFERKKEVCAS